MFDTQSFDMDQFIVLYIARKPASEKGESMMCRNDKSGVGPRWKYNNYFYSSKGTYRKC